MTIILVTTFPMTACNKENADNSVKKITLCEVTHSIFYAPQYVAIENGYFADEGLELTVTNGFGADKVMTALISGDADIGFMGSESSIYVYAEGSDDYAVNFAGLTQRAGNFLVGREANDNFEWSELKGKTVIGGRAGGMPQMLFEYILKKNNIDPANAAIAVQGMGNVGGTAAEIFYKNGQKVVAVSDYTGGLYCEDGLDIPAIRKFISEGNTLDKYEQDGVQHVTNDGLITCKCDVLIPAALENQITEDNAGRIQAKLIIEAANGPTSVEADDILNSRGIIVWQLTWLRSRGSPQPVSFVAARSPWVDAV